MVFEVVVVIKLVKGEAFDDKLVISVVELVGYVVEVVAVLGVEIVVVNNEEGLSVAVVVVVISFEDVVEVVIWVGIDVGAPIKFYFIY